MQIKALNIFWQPQCEVLVPNVKECLEKVFPWMIATDAGCKQIQAEAYDPSRYQYDALCLLKCLPDEGISLWIVAEDIYSPGYRYLYGAAVDKKAVVSYFRPDNLDEFKKEICHEVGHALGLKHCKGKCLMHVSRNGKQLAKKSSQLCMRCRKILNATSR